GIDKGKGSTTGIQHTMPQKEVSKEQKEIGIQVHEDISTKQKPLKEVEIAEEKELSKGTTPAQEVPKENVE
ncbi:hypothetical protein KI387_038478, partial [Taxus chinensis]